MVACAQRKVGLVLTEKVGGFARLNEAQALAGTQGHPGMVAYAFLRHGQGSRWLDMTLDRIEAGGRFEPRYHAKADFDHAHHATRRDVIASIGDQGYRLGPNSLVYFLAIVLGLRDVGRTGACVLRLGGAAPAESRGKPVCMSKTSG